MISKRNELLNIFVTEEDRQGMDILKMSNFFDVFTNRINKSIFEESNWKIVMTQKEIKGWISSAIKLGFDLSKINTLEADSSHLSKDIIEGLKKGIYHFSESKEVQGHFRPVVLDENERIVKHLTLKKAINPTEILSDISIISMQSALNKISSQIENVEQKVDYLVESQRRIDLCNKFLYARDKIMSAIEEDGDSQEQLLKEADTYLMEGLTNLYHELMDEVNKLAKKVSFFTMIKTIDDLLSHITEDIQMIHKYVGLRVYLLNFRGKTKDSLRVIHEFEYQLEKLSSEKLCNGKYTAFELIHQCFPYNESNIDFWIEQPQKLLQALKLCERKIELKAADYYFIEMED